LRMLRLHSFRVVALAFMWWSLLCLWLPGRRRRRTGCGRILGEFLEPSSAWTKSDRLRYFPRLLIFDRETLETEPGDISVFKH
jgi:hypothetical protein